MIFKGVFDLSMDQSTWLLPIFFVFLPFAGWAQGSSDKLARAAKVFQKADSLQRVARYDSSNARYKEAAQLFRKSGNWQKQAEALYQLSINKSELGDLDQSDGYTDRLLDLSRQHTGSAARLIRLKGYYQKGLIASTRANYSKALDWFQKGQSEIGASGKDPAIKLRFMIGIGDVYDGQGKYEEALQQFHEADDLYHRRQLSDKKLLSHIYSSMAISYQHNGDNDSALKYHRQVIQIDRKRFPEVHPELAKDYNNIAIVYYYRGDYKRALDYMKNAVNVLRRFYGEDHKLVAAGYNNVGVVYSEMGKLKEAAQYLEKALAIKKKILGEDHPDIAIAYQNLGALYFDMKDYDQAISDYKKAVVLHRERFPNGHPKLADDYANLGQAYAKKKEYRKALNYYRKDLNTNLKFLAADHPYIGDTYNKIAEAYSKIRNYRMALNYLQKALPIFVEGYSEEQGLQNPDLGQVVYPQKLLKTLELKAKTLHDYAEQQHDTKRMDQSLHAYLNAAQLIEKLQYSLSREGSKFLLRKQTHKLFRKGFKVAYTLARKTGNADYVEYAFYFAEKSKDQILLEQLQETHAEHFAGIPDSLIQRGEKLETQLTKFQQKLYTLAGSPQPSDSLKRLALEDSLFDTHRSLAAHIAMLEKSYPKYYSLKYRHTTIPSWQVRRQILKPGQAMVEYFMGPDSLYAFVITPKQFHLQKVVSDSLLTDDIHRYRRAVMKQGNPIDFAKSSYRLYQKLFEPIENLIPGHRLLIVADGPLNLLPFESLVTENPASGPVLRFRKLAYLIDDYTFSYAPSATYLSMRQKMAAADTRARHRKEFLGFAPAFTDLTASKLRSLYPGLNRPLNALPLSKTEVEKLRNLFDKPHGFWSFLKSSKDVADVFEDDRATEEQFKSLPLKDYQYIHLATHAFVSEEKPGQSAIVFAAPKGKREDGVLHASEIYNLQLDARLVTLSACNTGIGKMAKGEGMMSLSRAFQYAGARNLLVSLWNVDDRSTAKLMVDFYKRNEQDVSMPRALREAKLSLIEEGRYAAPRYWAPFVFIGS